MRSNIVIAGGLLLFGALVMATLKPVQVQTVSKITEHGIVTEMYETAFKDLVVKLKGQATVYYINRGTDHNLDLATLKDKIMYKPVVIQYLEGLNPLNRENSQQFISKLEYEGEVIYAE